MTEGPPRAAPLLLHFPLETARRLSSILNL
jgi:hypothetical protein